MPGFRVRRALSLSYLNVLPRIETVVQVPIMEGVPHLIENDSRIACHGVDVGMRMSIDPNIYPAVSDELCGIISFSMSRNSHETIFLPIPLFTETGEIHNKLRRA